MSTPQEVSDLARRIMRDNFLSCETLSWGFDPQTKMWNVMVKVYDKDRSEIDVHFLPNIEHAPLAIQMARAHAVFEFLGTSSYELTRPKADDQLELPVDPAPVKKERKPRGPNKGKSPKDTESTTSDAPASSETAPSIPETGGNDADVSGPTTTPETTPPAQSTKGPKVTVYDPEIKAHKTLLATFLNKNTDKVGDWANKPLSKKLSRDKLAGKPFLNDEGDILDSVKKLILETYKE